MEEATAPKENVGLTPTARLPLQHMSARMCERMVWPMAARGMTPFGKRPALGYEHRAEYEEPGYCPYDVSCEPVHVERTFMVHRRVGDRRSIKIRQEIPDEDGNNHDDDEAGRHSAPGVEPPLEGPGIPILAVEERTPEPYCAKPEIKRPYWPLRIDESHEEQDEKSEHAPQYGHLDSDRDP